ncbi:MAG: PLP-dependent aminotransferase family protein [Hyphomicrobiaceae bacterium]
MASAPFDYATLFRAGLPAPAARWNGFPAYNFVGGHNDAATMPVKDMVDAITRVLEREGKTLATYGLESGPLGYRPLRDFLAAKLERQAGITCTADEILITSGSLQGLDLVNQLLVGPGDTVIIEQGTYGGAMTRVNKLGARIVCAPLDSDGLCMTSLANILEDLKAKGIQPKYIYTIPTIQNPTGSILPEDRRRELLRLSAAYGVPIFEDECYSDLVWDGERPPALRGMCNSDQVIFVGSFSKSIAPALRVGYVVASWDILSRMLACKTDAGSGALEQMLLAEYCTRHFDAHVARIRGTLRAKLDALVEALGEHFGTAAEFEIPKGGIFLWVKLPDGVDTTKLAQAALAAGVAINPGAEWATDPDWGRCRLRICFANPPIETIRKGVAVLAEVAHRELGVPSRIANVTRG